MTLIEAVDFFKEKKGICSQAIFTMYNDKLNLGNVDHDTCMKISSAFCGGNAYTGNICGALMILGLKYGVSDTENASMKEEMKAVSMSQKLLEEFKDMKGSIYCKDLINHELKTCEDIQKAFENKAFDNCPKFVENTSKILDQLL